MRLLDLFEDVNLDKRNLSLAEKAWDDFMFEVKGRIELLGLNEFDYFEKTFSEIMSVLKKQSFKIRYDDHYIKVEFHERTSNRMGSLLTTTVTQGNQNYYFYTINIHYVDEDFDLVSINDFYRTFQTYYEKIFIHEFVHLLDHFRSKDKQSYMKTKRDLIKKGKYIDTPHEFNAFYMQMMKELKRALSVRESIELFRKEPTFDRFKSIVNVETMAGQGLRYLDGKYKKAFYKRLYQLYKTYYDELVENT